MAKNTKAEMIRRYVQLDLNASPKVITERIKNKEGVDVDPSRVSANRLKYLRSIGRVGASCRGVPVNLTRTPISAMPSTNGHAAPASVPAKPNAPASLSERLRLFLGAVESVGGISEARNLLTILENAKS